MKTRREFLVTGALGFGLLLTGAKAISGGVPVNMRKARLGNVNTTDIRDAILLGCETMGNVFNADDNDIPFFGTVIAEKGSDKDSFFRFSASHTESHVPGRHLNALLRAEDVLGINVNQSIIDKHANAALFSYSGAIPAPLNRDAIGGTLNRFIPHNMREGFHALYALTKYRNSMQARELAEKSIDFTLTHWSPGKGWNKPYLQDRGITLFEGIGHFVAGIARSIGPLVKYYRATGSHKALELAMLLKDKAVKEAFLEDGSYDLDRMGSHTHSVTCVMSSLAQLAELTADAPLMNRVKVFFDNGLKDISDEIGWSIESAFPDANPDRGESNNTGDIVETALILGNYGYTSYFDTAERILRAHLLPSQLRDISFVKEPANPNNEDALRDVGRRHKGAFGFPAPYGHKAIGLETISFNMDIVGGSVASLGEAYTNIATITDAGHHVNLLFDFESDAIKVESPYTNGRLQVTIKKPAPLFVRIPVWVDPTSLVTKGGRTHPVIQNGYMLFPNPPLNKPVLIDFTLPTRETVLKHRTRNIRVRWKGDSIVAMDNFGASLTYFDNY